MTRRLGVLGGTFDPIHFGHLDAADAARSALGLTHVLFVPAHDPPHRSIDPHASAYHRFALVSLAIDGCPGYGVSDLELTRRGSSYTSDTLEALHAAGWAAAQIFFILGADAFAEIATWHRFPAVLDLAHFVVIARPGSPLAESLNRTPDLRSRVHPGGGEAADAASAPSILLIEARTRDVSSTEIRRRIALDEPIGDLVPPAVARHIAAHRLYLDSDLHGEHKDK